MFSVTKTEVLRRRIRAAMRRYIERAGPLMFPASVEAAQLIFRAWVLWCRRVGRMWAENYGRI